MIHRQLFLAFSFFLIALPAAAQTIPIHGSPQKAAYTGTAPTVVDPTGATRPFLSGQSHWGSANTMPCDASLGLLNPCIGHVHIECNAPIWGELTGDVLNLPCQIQLFHLAGRIVAANDYPEGEFLWPDQSITNILDPFNVPSMVGNPMGIVKFPFTLRLTPSWDWRNDGLHGWITTRLMMRVILDNGAHIDGQITIPFFAMMDPSASLTAATSPTLSVAMNNLGSPFDNANGGAWGALVVESHSFLPILAPITAATNDPEPLAFGYSYATGADAPVGEAIGRRDIDLHNGIEGTPMPFGTFDATSVPIGPHKYAMIWREDTGDGNAHFAPHEAAAVLLVVTATVGTDVPPPTTCTDPLATNNGGPLPCVYPVVPPPPIWTLGTVFSTPTPAGLHFEVCAGLNPNDVNACHVVP